MQIHHNILPPLSISSLSASASFLFLFSLPFTLINPWEATQRRRGTGGDLCTLPIGQLSPQMHLRKWIRRWQEGTAGIRPLDEWKMSQKRWNILHGFGWVCIVTPFSLRLLSHFLCSQLFSCAGWKRATRSTKRCLFQISAELTEAFPRSHIVGKQK